MFKRVADITSEINFDIDDYKDINDEIGCNDFFIVPERGAGLDSLDVVINIGLDILAGLTVELIMKIIKTVYQKAKDKKEQNQESQPVNQISIVFNCVNYDCNNTNISFTIKMINDDETIRNAAQNMNIVAKNISKEK